MNMGICLSFFGSLEGMEKKMAGNLAAALALKAPLVIGQTLFDFFTWP